MAARAIRTRALAGLGGRRSGAPISRVSRVGSVGVMVRAVHMGRMRARRDYCRRGRQVRQRPGTQGHQGQQQHHEPSSHKRMVRAGRGAGLTWVNGWGVGIGAPPAAPAPWQTRHNLPTSQSSRFRG